MPFLDAYEQEVENVRNFIDYTQQNSLVFIFVTYIKQNMYLYTQNQRYAQFSDYPLIQCMNQIVEQDGS